MNLALMMAEAAWGTLLFDTLANGTAGPNRPAVDLPFLAIALAGVLAVVLAGAVRRWLSAALLGALVGAGITAELVASLTPGVAAWTAPAGPLAVRATTWAAIVAVLVWGRGTWVALAPPSVRQAGVSMVIGSVVVLETVLRRAASHSASFGQATADAGWLLAVFYLAGVVSVALAHVRSLERSARQRSGGARLAVVAVPLGAVVVVALLLGGASTVIGPAVVDAARSVGGALLAAGTWLFSHLVNIDLHGRSHVAPRPTSPALGGVRTRKVGGVLATLAAIPVAAAALGVLALLVAVLLPSRFRLRLRHRRRRSTPTAVLTRTSVFSWKHLWAQLRALVRRRHTATPAAGPAGAGAGAGVELDPVRAAYRRFLLAADAASVGREPAETPRELARRLPLDGRSLTALTAAYEHTRYGEGTGNGPEAEAAAAALAAELNRPRSAEASPDPSPGAPPPGGRRNGPSFRRRR